MTDASRDVRLIARYLAGDPAAYRTIQADIVRVVKNNHLSLKDQWDDICQDIHSRLVKNFRANKFKFRSPLRTYVYRVSKNTCLAYIRNRYARQPFNFPIEASEYQDVNTDGHLTLHKTVLQLLPSRCLMILRLYFLEGYSYREIGDRLKIKPGTVKSRFFRCKQKAKEIRAYLLKQGNHSGK